MKASSLLTILFLASLMQISFALVCSDLSQNQCNQLQTEGCIWSGTVCSGSYSPSCVPPNCYYIDPNSQSTATPDGTPGKPFKTLSDGFTKISGKDGFLIIINTLGNATVTVTKASTITSNVTVKPLFEDQQCTIDFTPFRTIFGTAITITNSLKVIGTEFNLRYQKLVGTLVIFSVSSGAGALYFENIEVSNAPNTAITLVRVTSGTFWMADCKFTDAAAYFQVYTGGTAIWRNVYGSGQNLLGTTMTSAKSLIIEDSFFTGFLGANFIMATTTYFAPGEILLKNCTFKDLTYSPLFTVDSGIKMTVEDCIFDQILITSDKLFVFQRGSSKYGLPSVIRNTSFTNIMVPTTLFYLDGRTVSLSLENVTMKNITELAYTAFSSFKIVKQQFYMLKGLCCSSVRNAQLSIEASNFSNIPSHCFGLKDTTLTLKSSIFDNSQLSVVEAPIVQEDISDLDENSGVSWITFEVTSVFIGQIYKVLIQDSKFIKNGIMPKSGGAIRFTGILSSQITITGSEFIGNGAYYGGAISSENTFVSFLKLENNLFVDNSAYHGGAIYKIDKRISDTLSNVSVSIKDSQFIGNKATKNGGALHLYWDSVWISRTEFISNIAVNGGALYYINLDETNNEKYGGMTNTNFVQNSASNIGGAMKLFFKYSQLNTEAMVFEKNFDSKKQIISQGRPSYYLLSFYDVAIADQIGRFDSLEDLVKNLALARLSFTLNTSESTAKLAEIKHKSGNELSQILQLQVFDGEHNVADYIDDEEIAVEMVGFQNNISNYSASLASSRVTFKVSNGQFFVKSMIKMHGEPKTTATLQFSNAQGFSDFIQDSGMEGSFDLQVHFVDCEEGDIFESSRKSFESCTSCIAGSYSFADPYKATHCNQCPLEIDCYGGNQVGPKSGYWMGDSHSLNAIKCPNPSACLGGYVDYEYFPNGKCLYPHQGNLCNQCAPKFAKFGSSTKCEACENNVGYYFKFVLLLVLQVAVILGLYKLNEKKQDETSTFYVNIMKIFINFIQINSIIITYNLEWSSLSKNFIHAINSFIPANHDGFPIDCFISLASPNNQNLIFVRLIATCFQPFIIWGLSILGYLFILLCSSTGRKDIRRKLKEALGTLFIISAFLVQPNIILTCLELFTCQNVGSSDDAKYILVNDSEVRCWTDFHLIWSFGLALPLLLAWAILLPVVLYCKTRKYSLNLPCWQLFFYQGLDKKRSYWEFLMLGVKTFVIILFTVLNIIQTETQILITFFVCISMAMLFLKIRPYTDPRLHILGFFSLTTLALVSYIGFFSFSGNWMGVQMMICSVLLVVANCGLFTLSAFYIIKDYAKSKRLEVPASVEAQPPQTETAKLSGTEAEQPKQSERMMVKNDDDADDVARDEDIEVCNELNQDIKIGKIYHAKKASVDNYSIMQSSGLGLLSPLQTSPNSRLLSPDSSSSSPMLAKQIILSPTIDGKGDYLKKTFKQKKINFTRINMKQLIVKELEPKILDQEKAVIENAGTEMTSVRTQGEAESENLLTALKFNTKNDQEGAV